ncbi:methyltransferase-like protein 22 isoform X2 [Sitodiplosis mosellana]|nr:methyltransferase-like protein 22 isoform X2 [Sitodiplosis mosellana]
MGENGCLEVTSEIYTETNFRSSKTKNGTTISHFSFVYPVDHSDDGEVKDSLKQSIIDADGDLIVERRRREVIQIEHQQSTNLLLVGLQVWRGALLLADFLLHNRWKFESKHILELGSGVGLTSIAAGIFSKTDIVCTDIDLGGILNVVKSNVELNKRLINNQAKVKVMELDFKKSIWSDDLKNAVLKSNIIIAADVIYDNSITDGFVETLERILNVNDLNRSKDKVVYIALEKRYVFTLADLDTMAPCYEYFLQRINEARKTIDWKLEPVDIDFPQYFDYERSKELIIMKLYV